MGAQVIGYEPSSVKKMLDEGKARLVDVREADEHARERIAGASLVALSAFDAARVPESNGTVTILHCRSGKRSMDASLRLLAAGHGTAAHMKGGIEAWKAAGLPVVSGVQGGAGGGGRGPGLPVMQQTQLAIGLVVTVSVALGWLWTPYALIGAAFFGCGLIYAGLSGNCMLMNLIAKMPWNRAGVSCGECTSTGRG